MSQFFFFLLFLCVLSILIKSTHLLSFLIGLEFLGLVVFLTLLVAQSFNSSNLLLVLFLLGAMGCESVVGLVLFVLVTRFSSKDYLLHMGLLKF